MSRWRSLIPPAAGLFDETIFLATADYVARVNEHESDIAFEKFKSAEFTSKRVNRR